MTFAFARSPLVRTFHVAKRGEVAWSRTQMQSVLLKCPQKPAATGTSITRDRQAVQGYLRTELPPYPSTLSRGIHCGVSMPAACLRDRFLHSNSPARAVRSMSSGGSVDDNPEEAETIRILGDLHTCLTVSDLPNQIIDAPGMLVIEKHAL